MVMVVDGEPNLTGGPISFEADDQGVPAKLELLDGFLIGGAGDDGPREKLLRLLLINVGLVRTLQLAPLSRGEQALRVVRQAEEGTSGR